MFVSRSLRIPDDCSIVPGVQVPVLRAHLGVPVAAFGEFVHMYPSRLRCLYAQTVGRLLSM